MYPSYSKRVLILSQAVVVRTIKFHGSHPKLEVVSRLPSQLGSALTLDFSKVSQQERSCLTTGLDLIGLCLASRRHWAPIAFKTTRVNC